MNPHSKSRSDILLVIFSSLLIAFVIWYIAKQADVENDNLRVAINLQNQPENVETKITPQQATITLQYPKVQKRYIVPSNFQVEIDFNQVNNIGVEAFADNQFSPTPQMYRPDDVVPATVRIISINHPSQILVSAKWILEKARVEPVVEGAPARGYTLENEVSINPSEVYLTGSREALRRARGENGQIVVQTLPISIAGKKESEVGRTLLQLPENLSLFNREQGRVHTGDPAVTYTVEIREKEEILKFPNVALRLSLLSKKASYEASPDSISVHVKAPVSLINRIQEDYIMFRAKNLDESQPFSGEAAIEPVWSEATPESIRQSAVFESFNPSVVQLNLTPASAEPE